MGFTFTALEPQSLKLSGLISCSQSSFQFLFRNIRSTGYLAIIINFCLIISSNISPINPNSLKP